MSGGVPENHLTDSGLKAVSDYCYNLEALFLSLLSTPGCTGLLPLLQDPKRACKLKMLSISIREVSLHASILSYKSAVNTCKKHHKYVQNYQFIFSVFRFIKTLLLLLAYEKYLWKPPRRI